MCRCETSGGRACNGTSHLVTPANAKWLAPPSEFLVRGSNPHVGSFDSSRVSAKCRPSLAAELHFIATGRPGAGERSRNRLSSHPPLLFYLTDSRLSSPLSRVDSSVSFGTFFAVARGLHHHGWAWQSPGHDCNRLADPLSCARTYRILLWVAVATLDVRCGPRGVSTGR